MPRAEIPESVQRFIHEVVYRGRIRSEMHPDPLGLWLNIEDLPKLYQHWLEQLKEELVEDAYCVEEFLRKVTRWEGCAEDELAEAIESAEKLAGALDSTPIPIEEGGDGD